MDFQYRTAAPQDHAWMVRVVDAWWGRTVVTSLPRLFLDHFHDTSIVIEAHGQPVAFLVGFMSPAQPDLAYIHFVGVDPHCRRHGLAASLYRRFFDLARARGRRTVKAITSPINDVSIRFHRSMGFDVSGPVADYDRPEASRVVFRREI